VVSQHTKRKIDPVFLYGIHSKASQFLFEWRQIVYPEKPDHRKNLLFLGNPCEEDLFRMWNKMEIPTQYPQDKGKNWLFVVVWWKWIKLIDRIAKTNTHKIHKIHKIHETQKKSKQEARSTCIAICVSGRSCRQLAKKGEKFCGTHATSPNTAKACRRPKPAKAKRCSSRTVKGSRCKRRVSNSPEGQQLFCTRHACQIPPIISIKHSKHFSPFDLPVTDTHPPEILSLITFWAPDPQTFANLLLCNKSFACVTNRQKELVKAKFLEIKTHETFHFDKDVNADCEAIIKTPYIGGVKHGWEEIDVIVYTKQLERVLEPLSKTKYIRGVVMETMHFRRMKRKIQCTKHMMYTKNNTGTVLGCREVTIDGSWNNLECKIENSKDGLVRRFAVWKLPGNAEAHELTPQYVRTKLSKKKLQGASAQRVFVDGAWLEMK
jgi:hypothetical protein